MKQEETLASLSNQWGVTALLVFMKESKVSYSTFSSNLNAQLSYIDDPNFSRHISKLSPGYETITTSDIAYYRITIENIILDLLDDSTLIHVLNSITKALKSAIVLGARILNPNKEVIRQRTSIKSGLSIPSSFYTTLNMLLSFIQKLFEKVPYQSLANLSTDIFDLMLDILLKRHQTNGIEGTILSILSSIPQYSSQIWNNILQISKMKEDRKTKGKLINLTEGVKVVRHYPESGDSSSTEFNLLEIISNIILLKGKWCFPLIIPIASSSLVFFFSKCKSINSNSAEALSSFVQAQFVHMSQNLKMESMLSFIGILPFSSETDFTTLLPKLLQILSKNYSIISSTSYFQVITRLVDGCVVRPNGCGNLFNLLTTTWFNFGKQITINPPYRDDSLLLINVFSSLFKVTPKETEDFFLKLLNSNLPSQTLYFIFSVVHILGLSDPQLVSKIAPAMVPIIKEIINKDDIPTEELQLVVPLLSVLWQSVPDFHSEITNLMVKCSKTKDITILGHAASFFIDIMEHYPVGSMPAKLLTTFSGQFLRRVDECVAEPNMTKNFKLYQSYVHAFIDYAQKAGDIVNEALWGQFLSLCESSTILQLQCHDVVLSLVKNNTQSLPLIMQYCFRASSLTTAHVASAIISSGVSSTDLAILSLGLSGRPSMICRAISAEIANTSSNAKFSPLACIDPLFEEKIVGFYASSFTPESVRKLMLQIPSLLITGESDPSTVQHFNLLQNRLNRITKNRAILTLLHLTAITEFSDLTPIKPLIPIWDKLFDNPPDSLENILNMILNEVKSITDAKTLTACCISFSRAFFKYPKQTATFILQNLRVTTDPNLSFDNFKPTTNELVISAVLSFIFDLETDRQRFVVCFLDHIRFILVWAIFLRFNPLYEHHHLPPLVTSIMHAAVPDSSLPLFVLAPSECVARAVYLPFRHTTELTSAQIASLLDVLKSFSKLTAELFLDTVAAKASSLAKYSPDFWVLFSNFFQPIHSTTFLNSFIANAQNVDLETVSMMLPLLIGMVKQNADPSHIAGFVAVIVFIISSTNDLNFLKVINKHLPKFVDTVIENEDSSEIISSTLLTIFDEHGGEEAIVENILKLIQIPDKTNSSDMKNVLTYIYELSRLLSISNATFSYTSIILFIFDSIRWLESNEIEFMISLSFLGLSPPKSYEELSQIILDKWVPKIVSFALRCVANFIGKTNIIKCSLKKNLMKLIMMITNDWKNEELMPQKEKIRNLLVMTMIGADSETSETLYEMFKKFIEVIGDSAEFSLVDTVEPLENVKENGQIKRCIAQKATPSFLMNEKNPTLSEVCEYIQNNILN
ncbi:hypothetical protein GPJ56_001666 [Histomonas meleagridis]|uniref:uncharacterized protein n=1 Tax=Histomonas meleagridis TaxID=135588 RepID=UPI00355A8B0A|nr:hypothetical protein GPJ56_001666 [Histomonas meleagridis]KAH0796248.1 hypothetical protein GO595_010141 [Histomonas meleagridis]